ncbi:MAG TPA: T9SS type A sorting domain-containing protein, partial [Bacteroidia bacterium]|nr:T9SS type A sorting domain-containing protein [Bacteroidia bacterium]
IWAGQPGNAPKIAEGGFHFRDGGTSSSSPVVAGIAALYLEQNPSATAIQVRNAIVNCAVQDTFTGTNLPNNIWGYGKADAFNTLTNCSLTALPSIPSSHQPMQLFPNPVTSGSLVTINIAMQKDLSKLQIQISDMMGKVMLVSEFTETGEVQIDTKKMSPGIYSVSQLKGKVLISVSKLVITD